MGLAPSVSHCWQHQHTELRDRTRHSRLCPDVPGGRGCGSDSHPGHAHPQPVPPGDRCTTSCKMTEKSCSLGSKLPVTYDINLPFLQREKGTAGVERASPEDEEEEGRAQQTPASEEEHGTAGMGGDRALVQSRGWVGVHTHPCLWRMSPDLGGSCLCRLLAGGAGLECSIQNHCSLPSRRGQLPAPALRACLSAH